MQNLFGAGGKGPNAVDTVAIDDHDLARLDITDEFGADDVQGAGFGGENRGIIELPQYEGSNAETVAHADQGVVRHGDQGIGAFDLAQGVDHSVDDRRKGADGDEMNDDLGIAGGLEQAAPLNQPFAHRKRVSKITVVGDG